MPSRSESSTPNSPEDLFPVDEPKATVRICIHPEHVCVLPCYTCEKHCGRESIREFVEDSPELIRILREAQSAGRLSRINHLPEACRDAIS